MSMNFKDKYTLDQRIAEREKIKVKRPDYIPIIVGMVEGSTNILKKEKYLAPLNMTLGDFLSMFREIFALSSKQSLKVFINDSIPLISSTIAALHESNKEEDDFLYMKFKIEDKMPFKEKYSLIERKGLCEALKNMFNQVPLIVERMDGKDIGVCGYLELSKSPDVTMGSLTQSLRNSVDCWEKKFLWLYINGCIPDANLTLGEIYEANKSEDGFLYLVSQEKDDVTDKHFQDNLTLEERIAESKLRLFNNPECVPFVVERMEESEPTTLMVMNSVAPIDVTVFQFSEVIRRIPNNEVNRLCLYVNGLIPDINMSMKNLYEENKAIDGFLYLQYKEIKLNVDLTFKENVPLDQRIAECQAMKLLYPTCVPIVIERVKGYKGTPWSFLQNVVDNDLTFGEFVTEFQEDISDKNIVFYIKGSVPTMTMSMKDLFDANKDDEDGFLYIQFKEEERITAKPSLFQFIASYFRGGQ